MPPETVFGRTVHREGLGTHGFAYLDSLADTGVTRVPWLARRAGGTGQGGDPRWESLTDLREAFSIFPLQVQETALAYRLEAGFSDLLYLAPPALVRQREPAIASRSPALALDRILTEMREQAGLPVGELARLLGVSRRQFYNWVGGENRPDPAHEKRVHETFELVGRLFRRLGQARLVRSALLSRTEFGCAFDLLSEGNLGRAAQAVEEIVVEPDPGGMRSPSSREKVLLELGHLRDAPRRGDG